MLPVPRAAAALRVMISTSRIGMVQYYAMLRDAKPCAGVQSRKKSRLVQSSSLGPQTNAVLVESTSEGGNDYETRLTLTRFRKTSSHKCCTSV